MWMKIEKKPIDVKTIHFKDINVGDCFYYAGSLYLKIREAKHFFIKAAFPGDRNEYPNAVNLQTNDVISFFKITNVQPANFKLVEY
jgi:hypothetical protein